MNLHNYLESKVYANQPEGDSKTQKAINFVLNAVGKIAGRKIIFKNKSGKILGASDYDAKSIKAIEEDLYNKDKFRGRDPILLQSDSDDLDKGKMIRPWQAEKTEKDGINIVITLSRNYRSTMKRVEVAKEKKE